MANTSLERKSATNIQITVELAAEDYRRQADAELKKLSKQVKLKGFRPGKVPMGYLRKLYGKGVLGEAIGKAVDQEINELIKAEELNIFGQLQAVTEPDLSNLEADHKESLTFVYAGGLMPSVDSLDTAGLQEVNRYTVALTDEEATKRVEEASKRFVDYVERDTIETEEDFATLLVTDAELDEKFVTAPAASTNQAEGEAEEEEERDPRQRYFLRPGDLKEAQRSKLISLTKGATISLALEDLNEDIKERFDKVIPDDGASSFTIAKVDREQMPELNAETFKKVFGEETEIEDLDAAKAEFSRRFAENSQRNLDDFALEQVIDKLIEQNELEVPNDAIKHRLEQARAEELETAQKEEREPEYNHELTEADRHGLARRLKWLAFRQQLLKEHEVELQPEDIDAGIERAYIQQLASIGLDPEQYRGQFYPMFKENLLKDRERTMEMTDGLLNVRLMKKLEEAGVLGAQKAVGEQEFQDIVEAYNKEVTAHLEEMRKQPLEVTAEVVEG